MMTKDEMRAFVARTVRDRVACVSGWSGFEAGSIDRMIDQIADRVADGLGPPAAEQATTGETVTIRVDDIKAAALEAVRPVCEERDRLSARVAELESALRRVAVVLDSVPDEHRRWDASLPEYLEKLAGPAGHNPGHSPPGAGS